MVKRQLTEEEKKLTQKNLDKQRVMLDMLTKAEEISQFQIEKSIPFSYEQELEGERIKHKRILAKIEETKMIIKVTDKQLIEGIEDLEEVDEEIEEEERTAEDIKAEQEDAERITDEIREE